MLPFALFLFLLAAFVLWKSTTKRSVRKTLDEVAGPKKEHWLTGEHMRSIVHAHTIRPGLEKSISGLSAAQTEDGLIRVAANRKLSPSFQGRL